MAPEQVLRLILIGLYSLVVAALLVAVPVMVWRARPLPEGALRRGGLFAALVLALQLPGIVVYARHYDPRALFDDDVAAPFVEAMADDVAQAMLLASVGSALLATVWRTGTWIAARVVHEDPAFPAIDGASRPWGSAVALGAGLGLVGVALQLATGSSADVVGQAPELFPGLPTSGPLPVLLAVCSGVAAGLAEELLFRGVLQRWLLRRLPAAGAIALAAIVVGCGQALAPHLPFLAMVRAGVFAAALGALAHRHGLETSFLAHTVLAVVLAAGTLVA